MYRPYPFEKETIRQKIGRVLENHRWIFNNKDICQIGYLEEDDERWRLMCKIWQKKVVENEELDPKRHIWKKLPMSFDNTAFIRDPDWGDMHHRESVYAYLDKWGTFFEDWDYELNFIGVNKGWKAGEKVACEDY